ncbi:hypothetical protein [Streptomyces somaliensis]|uniref:hypothetical protein n=1 Tax=Streptomyces somaliensis TaxID=78355 RepID=UPI0034E971F8
MGNPSAEPESFRAHLLGIRLGRTDVLEANWGFTWTDSGFAEARVPVFNALLALMLGSGTVSVYTACATTSWGADIDMDAEGLLSEGVDPGLHAPPYCPGAPATEDGGPGATAQGLRLLRTFLDRFGDSLPGSELERDAVLAVDRALPEAECWTPGADTALRQAAGAVHDLLLRRGLLVDPRWLDEDGTGDATGLPVAVLRPRAAPPRTPYRRAPRRSRTTRRATRWPSGWTPCSRTSRPPRGPTRRAGPPSCAVRTRGGAPSSSPPSTPRRTPTGSPDRRAASAAS